MIEVYFIFLNYICFIFWRGDTARSNFGGKASRTTTLVQLLAKPPNWLDGREDASDDEQIRTQLLQPSLTGNSYAGLQLKNEEVVQIECCMFLLVLHWSHPFEVTVDCVFKDNSSHLQKIYPNETLAL